VEWIFARNGHRPALQPTGLASITSSIVAIIVIAGAIVLIVYTTWKLKGRKKGDKKQEV
jgi:hypothetical protein